MQLLCFRFLALCFVGCTACAAASNTQLRDRAAFDLDCPKDQIRIIELDARTRGVKACGQRVTYVESCSGPKANFDTKCTWVLNSDTRTR